MIGRLDKVDDTKINYPVMQSKDNPNFYLDMDLIRLYSVRLPVCTGELRCGRSVENLVITVINERQFDVRRMMKYADKSFWKKQKPFSLIR
jgi:sortase B